MASSFTFPPPPSRFINSMSILSLVSLVFCGISEVFGKHLGYSKFWNLNSVYFSNFTISSRLGMFILYAPAAVAAVCSFFFFPDLDFDSRTKLLAFLLALHFAKRVFEVLFIHQYSGRMLLESAIPITLSYTLSTITMIYSQYLSQGLPQPSINLTYVGLLLFIIGIVGNFYHHVLLSNLRKKGDKGYKIPKGGLFGLVICPHYFFEILEFYGVFFISRTLYSLCFALGTTIYLVGRSFATRKWYRSKFENFPKNVKALVPFVF